jgi:acetyltransferase-like isoleucine patch superfamily enzyme
MQVLSILSKAGRRWSRGVQRKVAAFRDRRRKRQMRARGIEVDDKAVIHPDALILKEATARLKIGNKTVINKGVVIRVRGTGEVVIGDGTLVNLGCMIECVGSIRIGDNCLINPGCYLQCSGTVTIDDDCLFGPYVSVMDTDHCYESRALPIRLQGNTPPEPIIIAKGAWLGTKVTVTKGVTIGEGVVVGANAVVTKNLPEYAIAVGVPARILRFRPDSEILPTDLLAAERQDPR